MSAIKFSAPDQWGYCNSNAQVAKIVNIAGADKVGGNSNGTAYRPMTVTIKGHESKGPQAALALDRHIQDYPESFVPGKELLCTLRYKADDPQRNIAISVSPNVSTPLGARTTASDWGVDSTPVKTGAPVTVDELF